MKYDYLVFIGRFEPFHLGHLQVVIDALARAQTLIVLIGSSNQPRTFKNPWNYHERMDMIYNALGEYDNNNGTNYKSRVICEPLRDQTENDEKWASQVQILVGEAIRKNMIHNDIELIHAPIIGLVGHIKDASSYYLKLFPQWGDPIEHSLNEHINATDLRSLMFEGKSDKFLSGVVTPSVYKYITEFRSTPEFALLTQEYFTIKKYKEAWAVAPYPPIHVTVDAVIVQSAHILLVERAASPGKGLMALVGGFVEQDEFLQDAMLRELREETKLKVPAPVLIGSIKEVKVFDRPSRSARGRTITHAYHIQLAPGKLPPVKGGDDAAKAMWVPLSEVKEENMFDDHYQIIKYFTGIDA